MIHIVVAVRDRMLDAFDRPWVVPAVGAGVRAFQDELARPESPMNRHPEDYELFQLGTFDDATGELVSLEHPRSLSVGAKRGEVAH